MWVVKGGMVLVAVSYDDGKYCVCCTYQDDRNSERAKRAFDDTASNR